MTSLKSIGQKYTLDKLHDTSLMIWANGEDPGIGGPVSAQAMYHIKKESSGKPSDLVVGMFADCFVDFGTDKDQRVKFNYPNFLKAISSNSKTK